MFALLDILEIVAQDVLLVIICNQAFVEVVRVSIFSASNALAHLCVMSVQLGMRYQHVYLALSATMPHQLVHWCVARAQLK